MESESAGKAPRQLYSIFGQPVAILGRSKSFVSLASEIFVHC